MAMQYPFLFPYGLYRNNQGRQQTKWKSVIMCEFYAYKIQQRQTFLKGGRLFQQYLVDAYTAVEGE